MPERARGPSGRADPSAPDTCPNAGGNNQNIYGARVAAPAVRP